MDPSATPLDAYTAIIDQLIDETRLRGSGSLVADRGIFSNAPAHQAYNAFIRSLSPEHRQLLARMLSDERNSAIHDVLASLTWWITTQEVGLTFRGKRMPIELSGMGMHGDYIGRKDGWQWPK